MARRILKKSVEIVVQKALKIPQTELRQPKTIENNNNLIFVSTLKIFDLVKSSVNTLVEGSRYTSDILRKESGYSQVERYIRQPEHEKLKAKRHLRTCGKRKFTIFLFLQLPSKWHRSSAGI